MQVLNTSEFDEQYVKELDSVKTLDDLKTHAKKWKNICPDAFDCINKIDNPADFQEFQWGVKKERSGEFAGEEWAKKYSDITMPADMFRASMIAEEYKVPWGLAYIRMKEVT